MTINDWLTLLGQVTVVGVSATVVYHVTEFIAYVLWTVRMVLSQGRDDIPVPGYVKAAVSLVVALGLPSIIYAVAVWTSLLPFGVSNLIAIAGATFTTSWAVYQRSKYRTRAGEGIDIKGGR